MDEVVFEPIKEYRSIYAHKIVDVTTETLDNLVKKLNIDAATNESLALIAHEAEEKLKNDSNAANKLKKKHKLLKTVGILTVILLIGIIFLVKAKKLKPLIADADQLVAKSQADFNQKASDAIAVIEPIFPYLDNFTGCEIIHKTMPVLKLDPLFDNRKIDFLIKNFDYEPFDHEDYSTIGLQSGSLNDNPLYYSTKKHVSMVPHTYTGTLVITWTETYRDSQGHLCTRTRTQTLVAHVTEPEPIYSKATTLIYGNEAAPNLQFSRSPSGLFRPDEKQVEKIVKKGEKELIKKERKEAKQGGNFTASTNTKFDVLFNALDRDNEVQFRLLFSPLAQVNMTNIIVGQESEYGDDFSFIKRNMINYISSKHIGTGEPDFGARHYDLKVVVDTYTNKISDYFKQIYFDLAPLLSIPLYQEHKAKTYESNGYVDDRAIIAEVERAANCYNDEVFKEETSTTEAILKVKSFVKNGKNIHATILAHSFRGEPRLTMVPVVGGDGHTHLVPVHWIEYIPTENERDIDVQTLNLRDKDYYNGFAKDAESNNILNDLGGLFAFNKGTISVVSENGLNNSINELFDKIANKYKED